MNPICDNLLNQPIRGPVADVPEYGRFAFDLQAVNRPVARRCGIAERLRAFRVMEAEDRLHPARLSEGLESCTLE